MKPVGVIRLATTDHFFTVILVSSV